MILIHYIQLPLYNRRMPHPSLCPPLLGQFTAWHKTMKCCIVTKAGHLSNFQWQCRNSSLTLGVPVGLLCRVVLSGLLLSLLFCRNVSFMFFSMSVLTSTPRKILTRSSVLQPTAVLLLLCCCLSVPLRRTAWWETSSSKFRQWLIHHCNAGVRR